MQWLSKRSFCCFIQATSIPISFKIDEAELKPFRNDKQKKTRGAFWDREKIEASLIFSRLQLSFHVELVAQCLLAPNCPLITKERWLLLEIAGLAGERSPCQACMISQTCNSDRRSQGWKKWPNGSGDRLPLITSKPFTNPCPSTWPLLFMPRDPILDIELHDSSCLSVFCQ